MSVSWIAAHARGVVVSFHVQPNAPKTEVQGEHGGALKLRLAAPPVDGKANDTLVRWVAERLAVPRSAVDLISGEKDRRKRVLVTVALSNEAIETALLREPRTKS